MVWGRPDREIRQGLLRSLASRMGNASEDMTGESTMILDHNLCSL